MIKNLESNESVQRRATKLILKIKNLTYPEILKSLNLSTFTYRRAMGDMIELYRIISNIYEINTTQNILNFREKNIINLRGHQDQVTLEHKILYTASRGIY